MAEIDLLRQQLATLQQQYQLLIEAPPKRKDLTIASSLKEWSGAPTSLPVKEFFNSIDAAATMGNLDDRDKIHIAKLKVVGAAAEFLHCRPDLSDPNFTYKEFREAFEERFKEKLPENYHYSQLQMATQRKNESPEAFADRVKALSLKTIKPTEDAIEKRVLGQEAERRLLAAYTAGLRGEVGRQVRLRMPKTMSEAIQVAVTTQNNEQQNEGRNRQHETQGHNVFMLKRDIKCHACNRKGHIARDCRTKVPGSTYKTPRGQGPPPQFKRNPTANGNSDNKVQTCFYCKKPGHMMKDCRKKRWDNQKPENANATPGAPPARRN